MSGQRQLSTFYIIVPRDSDDPFQASMWTRAFKFSMRDFHGAARASLRALDAPHAKNKVAKVTRELSIAALAQSIERTKSIYVMKEDTGDVRMYSRHGDNVSFEANLGPMQLIFDD